MILQQTSPFLEKIEPQFGSSFTYHKFEEAAIKTAPAWHFHPELEIVYIAEGSGKRHIGNHISYFKRGTLVMLGPNLPHFGFIDRMTNSASEVVVQMKADFLGEQFLKLPETKHIASLFERSKNGLSFHGNIKKKIGERLIDMNYMTPIEKMLSFIKVLDKLAQTEEYKVLNAETVPLIVTSQDGDRINIIYNYVRENFREEIPLVDIARVAAMTVPSFCRYFKKHTLKTFTQFVNEFRIVHACKLISEEYISIADVCFECGFNNFSHFNRQFRKVTGLSPSEYKKELKANYLS